MSVGWKTAAGAAAVVAALVLLAVGLASSDEEEAHAPVLEHAEFAFGEGSAPPGPDAPWQPVTLPDDWYVSHPGARGIGWYRMTFDVAAVDLHAVHGIYVPRNSARYMTFYVNRQMVSGNRSYGGEPGTRSWSPPFVSAVSPAVLHAGRNELYARVVAVADLREGLSRVTVAQATITRPLYEVRYAKQVTSLFMFGAAALLSGLLAGALWLRQRNDPTLLWFAVTALAWAAAAFPAFPWLRGVATASAVNHGLLTFAGRFIYAAPVLMLGLRVAGRRWPRAEIALWLFTFAGLALSGLVSETHQGTIITVWSAAYLAALAALVPMLIRRPTERTLPFRVLAAALTLAVLLNAHDLAWWLGWIDYDRLQLAHFHVPVLLFAIGATILDRHFKAVAAVEHANVVLEERVVEKTREIAANFARLQEAEREQALARERQRIMADMHDGLGSSLVGLLGAVQSRKASAQDVERRLLEALQELRMSVDALEPVDGDLGVVLGNVRHRMRSAIEESGVKLHWRVGDLPLVSNLTPRAILNVQRIVSEALANALRHARASTVTVSARGEQDCLRVDVIDDGVGFAESTPSGGRGLDNLRHRAASLGATLEVRSHPGAGTRVALQLPLRLGGDAPGSASAGAMQ